MWALTDRWKAGYPDYHRHARQVEIEVRGWIRLQPIDDAYTATPRGWRRLVAYLLAYGPVQTLRKVRSRLRERGRDRKFASWGWGVVVEADPESGLVASERVVFIAPIHPACVSRVCLDERLVRPLVDDDRMPEGRPGTVLTGAADEPVEACEALAGWSRFSGRELSSDAVERVLESSKRELVIGGTASLEELTCPPRAPEASSGSRSPSGGRATVLFGLGNYAKNIVLPRISRYARLRCVHEIDPIQLGRQHRPEVELRTSAFPEADERYDLYLVAGYHHTHAPIAAHALGQDADVIVEKPLATTADQLEQLLAAMERSEGRLFGAFQRRYAPFNGYLLEDLALPPGAPIHCHCVVYEIPLPANHWYGWPESGTRIVSNGCHWIDHFLYLNGWREPRRVVGRVLANGDVVVTLDLEHGASFSMTLTEHGSGRLGVRDHVEFRAGDRTVTITDQRFYRAESTARVIRRSRYSARRPFDVMYERIGARLVAGEPGDSVESVRVSVGATLEADAQVSAELDARRS